MANFSGVTPQSSASTENKNGLLAIVGVGSFCRRDSVHFNQQKNKDNKSHKAEKYRKESKNKDVVSSYQDLRASEHGLNAVQFTLLLWSMLATAADNCYMSAVSCSADDTGTGMSSRTTRLRSTAFTPSDITQSHQFQQSVLTLIQTSDYVSPVLTTVLLTRTWPSRPNAPILVSLHLFVVELGAYMRRTDRQARPVMWPIRMAAYKLKYKTSTATGAAVIG